jgi:hypothetical protein
MTRTVLIRPLALIGLSLAVAPTFAAEGTHRCASVEADAARLQCYDVAFGKPAGAAASSAADGRTAVSAPAAAATAAMPAASDASVKAREEFGLSETEKRTRRQEPEDQTASITGQVAQLGRRPTGELVVSLADGQVWTQIESDDSRSRVKVGDTITIRKASLGSYLLVGPDRIAMRVRRVK